jgi:hypothetical protein
VARVDSDTSSGFPAKASGITPSAQARLSSSEEIPSVTVGKGATRAYTSETESCTTTPEVGVELAACMKEFLGSDF